MSEDSFYRDKCHSAFYESGKRVESSLTLCTTGLLLSALSAFLLNPTDSHKVPLINLTLNYGATCGVLTFLTAIFLLRHQFIFLYNRILYFRLYKYLNDTNPSDTPFVWTTHYPSITFMLACSPMFSKPYNLMGLIGGVFFGLGMHFIPPILLIVVLFRGGESVLVMIFLLVVASILICSYKVMKAASSPEITPDMAERLDKYDVGYLSVFNSIRQSDK